METAATLHLVRKAQKMENPKHSIEFETGRLVLQSPCHVGKEAFSPAADGNKFCSQCQKVVHDMTKMTETEIKALFMANAGKVCGSIRIQTPQVAPIPAPVPRFRKPAYFKQLAASAAFLLLYHSQQAKPASKPQIAWQWIADQTAAEGETEGTDPDWKANTLVTGVVINQDSELVPLEIPVFIYHGKTLIAQVNAVNGMFTIDLGNKLKPQDVIEIKIKEQKSTSKLFWDHDAHGAGTAVARLADAQNLNVKVEYFFPDLQIDGGLGWEDAFEAPDLLDLPIDHSEIASPSQP